MKPDWFDRWWLPLMIVSGILWVVAGIGRLFLEAR